MTLTWLCVLSTRFCKKQALLCRWTAAWPPCSLRALHRSAPHQQSTHTTHTFTNVAVVELCHLLNLCDICDICDLCVCTGHRKNDDEHCQWFRGEGWLWLASVKSQNLLHRFMLKFFMFFSLRLLRCWSAKCGCEEIMLFRVRVRQIIGVWTCSFIVVLSSIFASILEELWINMNARTCMKRMKWMRWMKWMK